VILGFGIILDLTLLGIYASVQRKKENYLKVLGSFSPEKLQQHIDLIEMKIFQIENII